MISQRLKKLLHGMLRTAWALTVIASLSTLALADYPKARFAVISDLHYYDSSLGTTGKAFEAVMDLDRKLLPESQELLIAAIDAIGRTDAQFVLIPGDLTKDGELVNHLYVAAALRKLTDKGKRVFVVPGNHDINNPVAQRFEGDKAESVPTIAAKDFAEIYSAYGYAKAVKRDSASLSYVAEPVPGLWLLAIDACRYDENAGKPEPVVAGRVRPETMTWIGTILKEAEDSQKSVVAMMHHGVLEHFVGQKGQFPEYVVEDNMKLAELLAKNGCRVTFTGHFHSQDITTAQVAGTTFSDVETGSLVTYPNPWRLVDLSASGLQITSSNITSIPSRPDLAKYSREYVLEGLQRATEVTLRKYKVGLPSVALMAPQIAERFLLNYQGDEPKGTKAINTKGVSLWGKIVSWLNGKLMRGVSNDLAPADLNVTLAL